jgi:glyoxylase-like metal-dependent hydrolase (beta-lactamase superfamily II)
MRPQRTAGRPGYCGADAERAACDVRRARGDTSMKQAMVWGLLALLAGCAAPAVVEAPPLAGEPLAVDVSLLRGAFVAGQQPDGNTVLLRGRDGLVVFDTGRHANHVQRIIDAARADGRPVVAIVNSHWHLDHVSGNAALRDASPRAQVYASGAIAGAMTGFLAGYRAQLQQMIDTAPADSADVAGWREEIARIDSGAKLAPTRVVTTAETLTLAGRPLRLGLETDAVSGGDVWMLDRRSGVLAAGDLVTLPAPLLDTACAEGWREALARLDAVDFTLLVPGHGAPMDRAGFRRYRAAFDGLLACAAGGAPADTCRAGWLRDAGPLIPPSDTALASTLLDYYIGQVLRAPQVRRQQYCHAVAPR